jgi:hypothetical protein
MSIRTPLLLLGVLPLWSCGAGTPVTPETFPDLEIVGETLSTAYRGEPFSISVSAQGGDQAYTWEVTAGSLPPGLTLTVGHLGAEDALITGVPEAEGSFTFTLTVTSGDGQAASRSFTLEVVAVEPLSIETPAVPPALVGRNYNVRLRAYGGDGETYEWQLAAGGLPPGMQLTTGGRLTGSPTQADTARFTVRVRSGRQTAQHSYTLAVVPEQPQRFNITLFPVSDVAPGVRAHLADAMAEWHAVIQNNLPVTAVPDGFYQPEHCGGFGDLLNGTTVDDIIIVVNIASIDGRGGILGRAGPCGVRSGSSLPFAGVLTLDADDLNPLVGNETLTYIISHEIAHVLGFGTLWRALELIEGARSPDPRFVGSRAVREFQALGGEGTVPVENQGGEGTRDSHWRQSIFRNERMTGFSAAPGVFQPLSRVSVGSFEDLGYTIDMSAADSFSLAAALAAGGEGGAHSWGDLGYDEVLLEPIRVLRPDGTAGTIQPQ